MPGISAIVDFTWNTASVPYGNYILSANATIVPDEEDTADNNLIYGAVLVAIPGDVDGSGKVNYEDLFALADAYGSYLGDLNWDSRCDINDNDRIEYEDLFALADHYGMP